MIGINRGTKGEKKGLKKYLGKSIFIRTVTYHYTGLLKEINKSSIVLEKACWIPDDGRFNQFLKDPVNNVSEVEPFEKEVLLMKAVIIDVTEIPNLPREVK